MTFIIVVDTGEERALITESYSATFSTGTIRTSRTTLRLTKNANLGLQEDRKKLYTLQLLID